MTREEMLAEIDQGRRQLAGLRARAPSDVLLEQADQMLNGLRADVVARWPLAAASDIAIGRFAVRAFDDGAYRELVARLVRIDALAKGRASAGARRGGGPVQPPQPGFPTTG